MAGLFLIGTQKIVIAVKTGLFRKVDYTGYTYEDGVYVLSLNCILLGEEAAE